MAITGTEPPCNTGDPANLSGVCEFHITDKQAIAAGKQAADKLYIISILDKLTVDIDKIREIMLKFT